MTAEEMELEKAFLEAAELPEVSSGPYVGYQGYKTKKKAAKKAAKIEKKKKPFNKKKALIISCCALLMVALALGGAYAYFMYITTDDGLVYANVYVDGINLGGKTPEEAKQVLQSQLIPKYTKDMVVTLPDGSLTITSQTANITIDIDSIVDDAYSYGREGTRYEQYKARNAAALTSHKLALTDYLTMDSGAIREALNGIDEQYNIPVVEPTVVVNGERPTLTSKDEAVQTLTITMGQIGVSLDVESLYSDILAAYADHIYQVEAHVVYTEPSKVDLQPLYDEYFTEPVNAEYVKENEKCIVKYETFGYQFDLEALQEQISSAEYGEVIEASFCYTEPEILGSYLASVLFDDKLGECDTYQPGSSDNRNVNLALASEALNSYIIMPGETFSYNECLGPRTAARGYKAATVYSGGQMVQGIGGGVCQGASACYYAALMADFEIVERRAHSYDSSYVPLGMDATISWGSIDFKFVNNTGYPIRIYSYSYNGGIFISYWGTNTKDYYVEMDYEILSETEPDTKYKVYAYDNPEGYKDGDIIEAGHRALKVKTYMSKFDKKTKELISREYVASSTYKSYPRTVVKIDPSTIPADATDPTSPTDPT